MTSKPSQTIIRYVHHQSNLESVPISPIGRFWFWFSFLIALSLIFYRFQSVFGGIDFHNAYQAAHCYTCLEDGQFIGNPFSLLLIPHAYLFSDGVAGAINHALLVVVPLAYLIHYQVKPIWLLFVFTFPPYLHLHLVNNIDWIPLLALLLPPPFLIAGQLAKPQLFGLILLAQFKTDWRLVITVTALVTTVTLLVFGLSPLTVSHNTSFADWNVAALIFPYGIVLGTFLAYRALSENNETLLILSTPLMVPYIASYSFGIWFVVLITHYPRMAIWIYGMVWLYLFYRLTF